MDISDFINRYLFRKYRLWVINTPAEAQLYLWINYKLLYPHIDALLSVSRAKAFIRSSQSIEGKNGWLGFGRMAWTKENNEKWTKKYRMNKRSDENIEFFETQIWAPDWNNYCNTGVPPDVFIEIYNFQNDTTIREGVIVAIPDRIYKKHTNQIDIAIDEITKAIPEPTLSTTFRSWSPDGGFPNQIQDINNWEIAKVINNA